MQKIVQNISTVKTHLTVILLKYYGQLIIMAMLFWPKQKLSQSFFVKTTIPLIWPDFCDPLMMGLRGLLLHHVHVYVNVKIIEFSKGGLADHKFLSSSVVRAPRVVAKKIVSQLQFLLSQSPFSAFVVVVFFFARNLEQNFSFPIFQCLECRDSKHLHLHLHVQLCTFNNW